MYIQCADTFSLLFAFMLMNEMGSLLLSGVSFTYGTFHCQRGFGESMGRTLLWPGGSWVFPKVAWICSCQFPAGDVLDHRGIVNLAWYLREVDLCLQILRREFCPQNPAPRPEGPWSAPWSFFSKHSCQGGLGRCVEGCLEPDVGGSSLLWLEEVF